MIYSGKCDVSVIFVQVISFLTTNEIEVFISVVVIIKKSSASTSKVTGFIYMVYAHREGIFSENLTKGLNGYNGCETGRNQHL
jgi:hypothetical protein